MEFAFVQIHEGGCFRRWCAGLGSAACMHVLNTNPTPLPMPYNCALFRGSELLLV